jgi:hypothetical protein
MNGRDNHCAFTIFQVIKLLQEQLVVLVLIAPGIGKDTAFALSDVEKKSNRMQVVIFTIFPMDKVLEKGSHCDGAASGHTSTY